MKPSWLIRSLLAGTAMVMPAAAFAQETDAQEGLQEEQTARSAPDVSIPGEILVTGRVNRDPVRSADQVVSILSTEDIARTGEGDIAGALGRVTGLSVVGSGYVYVRGLGDRYSLALLNGLPLPSPEPLRRVVPLDIFPTNIVASSMVQKSYSANFPGEFGGGVINLTTIAVPDESFLSIGAGISFDTETTLQHGYSYFGSKTDWTGFDNGSRKPQADLAGFLKGGLRIGEVADKKPIIAQLARSQFSIVSRMDEVPANVSGSITGGTAFDMGEARVGVIATASYSNEWTSRNIIQQAAALADLSLLKDDFRAVRTQNHITVNGMLGLGVELGKHKFRLTNLYIRDVIKDTRLAEGTNVDSGFSRIIQDTGWYQRQLINTQFVGEMRFDGFGIDLRGGYANSKRKSPFETSYHYVRTNQANDPLGQYYINRLNNGQTGGAWVAFSDLNEDLWYGGADLSVLVTPRMTATAGYAYTDTKRVASRREFAIIAPSSMPAGIGLLRADLLIRPTTIEFYDFNTIETTESDPAFQAGLRIHGAYGKIVWEPIDPVSIDLGVRYETARQTVAPLQIFETPSNSLAGTQLNNEYWLPSATVTWKVAPDFQLRGSVSKTIARPQFRELIFQLYYDPEANRTYRGNPNLQDSTLKNAELRAEYYISRDDRVSVAGFYKDIKNPIETFITFDVNGSRGGFANAPKAQLYGAEFEFLKNFDLSGWGGFFGSRKLVTIANYTYSQSKLKVPDNSFTAVFPSQPQPSSNYFQDGARLTGQSNHVANLQIGLEDQDRLSQQTILLNYASKRIVGRGDLQLPDIIENPGLTVDFVARQGFRLVGVETEWKFEVRNIFGQNYEEYQAVGDNRIDVNSYDVGRKISLSISAKF